MAVLPRAVRIEAWIAHLARLGEPDACVAPEFQWTRYGHHGRWVFGTIVRPDSQGAPYMSAAVFPRTRPDRWREWTMTYVAGRLQLFCDDRGAVSYGLFYGWQPGIHMFPVTLNDTLHRMHLDIERHNWPTYLQAGNHDG